jgi:DNA replication protein DnaC
MESAKDITARLAQSLQNRAKNIREEQNSQPINCETCGDTGFEMVKGCARECVCARERRVISRLPERYQKASLLDFNEGVRAAIIDWCSKPGDGLLISGATGRGKTHLACAITRTLLLINREAYFKRCDKMYMTIRDGYRSDLREESILSEFIKGDYLVLDDLGAGGLSDHERRCTLSILDDRLELGRSTIITSNWELDQIAEKMDDRIASRLASFVHLNLQGRDRRIPKE